MASEENGREPLLDQEAIRPIGDIEASHRRRRKGVDRESARAVKGGATRGSYRKLALAAIMLGTVGIAFALLITAVELAKVERPSTYDLGLDRRSPDYHLFLASAGKLLPAELHARVTGAELRDGRVIVIGDVHGCLDELKDMLDAVDFQEGNDTVILVGDLVDKGPYSLEVLAEARRLNFLSVRGNHDDKALAAYEAYKGGKRVPAKRSYVEDMPQAAAKWLHALPFSISLPSYGVVVVHAGIVPDVPLTRQQLGDLYIMREVANTSSGHWKAEEAKCDKGKYGLPWASVWDGPEHIIFGHDHQRGLQKRKFATGIDTGCCYGDRLTAVVLPPVGVFQELNPGWTWEAGWGALPEGAKLVSVPARKKYYDKDPCKSV